ncbi:MAG: hypothetical protein NVS4B7_01090 [Ktedonobacteraceae bacterium]
MSDPRFLTLFIVVFILLGVYNVFTGLRRQREAQTRGQRLVWYKQINLLTGLEYLLLSFVFMISLNIRNNAFPSGLKSIVVPLYLIVLLLAAILAGFVIRQAFANSRRGMAASSQGSRNGASKQENEASNETLTPEQRAVNIQRRRERRQKAAVQRRRRTGRA